MCSSFLIPLHRLDFVLLNAFAHSIQVPELALGSGISLQCRFLVPFHRFGFVLGHASATCIHVGKVALCLGESLRSGFLIPFHSFLFVFGNAVTLFIHQTEIALGLGVSLKCSSSNLFYACQIIFRQIFHFLRLYRFSDVFDLYGIGFFVWRVLFSKKFSACKKHRGAQQDDRLPHCVIFLGLHPPRKTFLPWWAGRNTGRSVNSRGFFGRVLRRFCVLRAFAPKSAFSPRHCMPWRHP